MGSGRPRWGLLFECVVVHVRSDAGRRLQFKSDRARRADRVDPATKLPAGARGCVVVVLEKGALLDLRYRVHGVGEAGVVKTAGRDGQTLARILTSGKSAPT